MLMLIVQARLHTVQDPHFELSLPKPKPKGTQQSPLPPPSAVRPTDKHHQSSPSDTHLHQVTSPSNLGPQTGSHVSTVAHAVTPATQGRPLILFRPTRHIKSSPAQASKHAFPPLPSSSVKRSWMGAVRIFRQCKLGSISLQLLDYSLTRPERGKVGVLRRCCARSLLCAIGDRRPGMRGAREGKQ